MTGNKGRGRPAGELKGTCLGNGQYAGEDLGVGQSETGGLADFDFTLKDLV